MRNRFKQNRSENPYDKPLVLGGKSTPSASLPHNDNALAYDPVTKSGTPATNAFLKQIVSQFPAAVNRTMKATIEKIGVRLGEHSGKIDRLERQVAELQAAAIAKDDQANSGDPAEYGKMLEAARLHKATMAARQDTSLTEQERDAEAQDLLNAASKIKFRTVRSGAAQ